MSGLPEIVDSLESKIEKLSRKLEELSKKNRALENEISASAKVETLKIANSLLGSDDNKRDTKLKINSLIREIDYCIAQLSD